ncbi:16S rRNA (guanine(966)-N(2))-methyltransferase RsmD [Ectothiorhodospiraceae bacterium BW-2]|nr:16S rRNA (guanine(966)-N(2))-methyltransferase RsmD [Ectothiorhodospiraceae bacterium BW-2]
MARSHQLRIIGGKWRSRKLPVLALPGLRPTTDRVRETLFNWLQGSIASSRCLDLFAGSGALGLEALSRGAVESLFVDRSAAVVEQLQRNLALLQASEQARVVQSDALAYLSACQQPFDIIFIDPPFGSGLLPQALTLLQQQRLLTPKGVLYFESDAPQQEADMARCGLQLLKQQRAGQVWYGLAE